jgi:photosystem II stability/assembly factor-like uncharacterized protein
MGLFGGQILDIAIDPADADKIFAGAYMGDGLYVTGDGGESWQAAENVTVHSPPQNHENETPNTLISLNPTQNREGGSERLADNMFKNRAVSAVKIAPSNNNIIWVAHNCRVEKSTDGGKSWTRVAQCPMKCNCQNCGKADDCHRSCISLAIDPSDAQTVYMGTTGAKQGYYAIYKTEDGGKTWTKTNPGNDFDCRVVDIDIDHQNTDIIWAVTNRMGGRSSCAGGLYRSEDRGETWEKIMTLDPGFTTVAVNPKDSNSVFTGSYSNKDSGIKEHYFDGDKWLCRTYIPIDVGYSVVLDIAFAPQDPHVLYAAWKNIRPGNPFPDVSRKVSRSITGEKYWKTYTVDYEFNSLAVHPANSNVIFGGERHLGIYKSQDYGQSWYPANNGISAVLVYDVAIDPNDSAHILAGTLAGIYERELDKKTWPRLLQQGTYSLEFHPTDSLTFYAGTKGYLAKTTDGGLTWSFSNYLGWCKVNDIAIDSHNTDTVYIAASRVSDYPGRIYKSENGGASFSEVLVAKNQYGASYDFNVVTLDPTDPEHVFAGGGDFYYPRSPGDLLESQDEGKNWNPGDLWESQDGGTNWIRTGLKDEIVNAILIDPQNTNIMYAGCGHSISAEVPLYKSTDGGENWLPSFAGIPGTTPSFLHYDGDTPSVIRKHRTFNRAVTDLEFHRKNKKVIYASTYSAGVYISPNQARNWLNLGIPKHNVRAISTSSLYAGTQGEMLQCTGTGIIAGNVIDDDSGAGIHLATVSNSTGGSAWSICLDYRLSTCGEYGIDAPAGISTVTATAAGYSDEWRTVTVYGGDVTWMDFIMHNK